MLNCNISTATDGTILISIDPKKKFGETVNSKKGETKTKVYTVASSGGFQNVNGIKVAINAIVTEDRDGEEFGYTDKEDTATIKKH